MSDTFSPIINTTPAGLPCGTVGNRLAHQLVSHNQHGDRIYTPNVDDSDTGHIVHSSAVVSDGVGSAAVAHRRGAADVMAPHGVSDTLTNEQLVQRDNE